MPMLTVGHRGVMGVEPENTLRSFVRAEREGLDVLELDLHLSKDGELVVMHDADVARTTDGSGPIGDFTLAELRELDAGEGERVPVFDEVVDAVSSPLQAEIKDRAAAQVLARTIEKRGLHERVTVISFHAEALRETREHLPDIPLVLVAGRSSPTAPERAEELGAGMISLELEHVDEDVVQRAHARGIKVISWTVNTDEDLARARGLGLDGVVTDMPEISRAVGALS
ncbi:glycerophosphodiester phosphodiesterase family protein [Streptomyces sp. NBC_01795]|nr:MULTISPECIES: glycerophosphodiester phosphodiesterase family protein [unclassified Streptomyces]WSA96916.1 glycerophosphodiester phosphodiesterase family protein [Streptomyces sp. NBC_01795]WSB81342.1 glycerophosphodiester phosphodiesterase family protein [Streptomyces sp. NBC_01775]WSS17904.1 glycerophosphodiester phosphodiesterase family protein [Streptomyces sp. NBC_01186]WSS46647.1 glycerophosphodiester phosphodiesterase family protein [Streptomyces sp. NBC_01187]